MAPSQPRDLILDLPTSLATRTSPQSPDIPSRVLPRQATITVVTTTTEVYYGPGQLSGGAIAGIVIGSVIGFALIIGLVWWALGRRGEPDAKPSYYREEIRGPHHRHHHHHHRHHSRGRASRSRSRNRELRVVTSQTTTYPGYCEPVSPARAYYQEKRHSRRSSRC